MRYRPVPAEVIVTSSEAQPERLISILSICAGPSLPQAAKVNIANMETSKRTGAQYRYVATSATAR
jgi:hypothetical protein